MERKLIMIAASSVATAILVAVLILVVRSRSQPAVGPPPAGPAGSAGGATDEADEQAALKVAEAIDPAAITYHEIGSFPVGFRQPRALAVDAEGAIYVGGDLAVVRYSDAGKKLAEIPLEAEPRCLAIGAPDGEKPARLYVGLEDHVEVYDPQGKRVALWASCGTAASLTSIAATEHQVWAADAANRLVWRFDAAGKSLEPVGRPDPSRNWPGFLITSHYFDLAEGNDGLVYVVNPRVMRVEGYTENGEYETAWGKGSPAVADFFGCCNPAHLAVLPDGRFVTAEKGLPRVKIYSRVGQFETVVAGPAQLRNTPADLAADRGGRVLVLDGREAKVRVFVANSRGKGEKK